MLVAIHQPHYLPWLGYLHRMAQADLFILLDHVQFERGNYPQRGPAPFSAGLSAVDFLFNQKTNHEELTVAD